MVSLEIAAIVEFFRALALLPIFTLVSVRPHTVMLIEHDVHEARPVVSRLVLLRQNLAIFVPVVVEVFEETQLVEASLTGLVQLLVLLLLAW